MTLFIVVFLVGLFVGLSLGFRLGRWSNGVDRERKATEEQFWREWDAGVRAQDGG